MHYRNLLELEGLVKVFGRGTMNEKKALDNVSLSVCEGEFITIIGSNGAGKSTLMNCIAGVYMADKGTVKIDGGDVTRQMEYKRARQIGRVFQDPLKGTAADMSVEENLAIADVKGKMRGLQKGITRKQREYLKARLELLNLGLENRLKEKVRYLSGGQRQALTLLMATLVRPRILLLDEHTAALDPGVANTVLKLTDQFAKEPGMCTLMITHNMKAALEHGNRTIVMRDGRIDLDISGEVRKTYTIEKFVEEFQISNDRMLI